MKRYILSVLIMMTAFCANAQEELYIYRHGTMADTLQMGDVVNISHSKHDLHGIQQKDYVVMAVEMYDGNIRKYLLSDLDSVVMRHGDRLIHLTRFIGSMNGNINSSKSPNKTSLDGDFTASTSTVDFFWEDGDHIYLADGRKDTEAVYSSNRTTADFFFDGNAITDETVDIYYPGQSPLAYNEVRVAASQSQQEVGSSRHIGLAGDCGTATAIRQNDGTYLFNLQHHASYLCFLPFIANDLGRTVLKSITVRSNGGIAGIFNLSTDGMTPKKDVSHSITLETGDFILPKSATQATSAYMVIAPQNGSTRLTCEFTVYDTELQSTGTYVKTVELQEVKPNMVYVIKANLNNYVVDLGLPVKVLNHNAGATAPEHYGGYYAWGEVEDKGNYTTSNYLYQNSDIGNEIRKSKYDVAYSRLGRNLSLPTSEEVMLIADKCTWTWTTVNGINGHKLTGPNGNCIFMPAGGYRSGTDNSELTSRGCYRTSTLVGSGEKRNWYLNFYSGSHDVAPSGTDIYLGESIRPVESDGMTMTDGNFLQVYTDKAEWNVGDTKAVLHGTVNGYSTAVYSNVEAGFVVGTSDNVTLTDGQKISCTVSADGAYTGEYPVTFETTYYCRAYAKDADGNIVYANAVPFCRSAVDLGLPSGTLWSSINVGASSPETDGNYYSWAETETKTAYTDATFKWLSDGIYMFPDGLRNVQATRHDVASVTWGGTWMSPDYADLTELVNNCTITLSHLNGTEGYNFTSKINGNSIFIPLSGYRYGSAYNYYANNSYLSSSELRNPDNRTAYMLYNNTANNAWGTRDALPSRPVLKTNATAANGTKLYIRTLHASKLYDGTTETNTLKAVVRGVENAGEGNSFGFAVWKESEDQSTATNYTASPDAESYMTFDVTGLTPGVRYCYAAYVNNGTETFYGNTMYVDALGAVDLGLSVKWANVNLGASCSEETGEFWRWGATEPYRNKNQQLFAYTDITPESGRDIATNTWGLAYRMPSKDECQELRDNCTWTWTTVNGRTGYLITSNVEGYTDRSIFLPVAGYYYDSRNLDLNVHADYWTSTAVNGNVNRSYRMYFNSNTNSFTLDAFDKWYGFPVRPVQENGDDIVVTCRISRDTKSIGETCTLTGNVRLLSGRNNLIRGFIYGDNADITVADCSANKPCGTAVDGEFTAAVSNLEEGKTYYYKAYLYDGTSYQYGKAKSFQPMEMVDLGLPSGTLWANTNLGADNPEDFGDYYAWGETETKTSYTQDNYKYYQNGSYLEIGSDIAGTEYDAATAHLGTLWSTPTQVQCKELIDNCTWTQETVNGIACWKVTNKSDNTKFILLPKAGRMNGTAMENDGCGLYMPSTRYNNVNCNDFYMPSGGPQAAYNNYNYKYKGMSVRAVSNAGILSGSTKAHVTTGSCKWHIGETTATLSGNVSMSASVEGMTYGIVVGDKPDVDYTTADENNIITLSSMDSDGDFSAVVSYDGKPKYYRAFLKAGDTVMQGEMYAVSAASLLDVEFTEDGTAINASPSAITGTKTGTHITTFNNTYQRYETSFSQNGYGGSAGNFYQFYFELNSDFMNRLADGHSVEVLFKTPSTIPNNNESYAVASYQNGGSGIGIYQKKLHSSIHLGGNYKAVDATTEISPSTYYHVVMTWDKDNGKLKLYIDGEETSSLDVSGDYRQPDSGSRYVVVGGDPSGSSVSSAWNGTVVFARIYDNVLTADEVRTLYDIR